MGTKHIGHGGVPVGRISPRQNDVAAYSLEQEIRNKTSVESVACEQCNAVELFEKYVHSSEVMVRLCGL